VAAKLQPGNNLAVSGDDILYDANCMVTGVE